MLYTRLKDLKEDSDITQQAVADIIGMSLKQYARYERGEADIPLQAAIKLAKYYNVSLDYIAGISNDKRGLTKSNLPNTETKLLNTFRMLSEEGKSRILERLDVLIEEQNRK